MDCDHEWFNADGWLSEDDQYCIKCFKNRVEPLDKA